MIPLSDDSHRVLLDVRNGKYPGLDEEIVRACCEALAFVHETNKRERWKELSAAPRAYEAWRPDDEHQLVRDHEAGLDVFSIARRLGRSPRAIRLRLSRLGYKPRDKAA